MTIGRRERMGAPANKSFPYRRNACLLLGGDFLFHSSREEREDLKGGRGKGGRERERGIDLPTRQKGWGRERGGSGRERETETRRSGEEGKISSCARGQLASRVRRVVDRAPRVEMIEREEESLSGRQMKRKARAGSADAFSANLQYLLLHYKRTTRST